MERRKFLQAAGLAPFISKQLITTGSIGAATGSATSSPVDTSQDFFYKPSNGWAADFIPLFSKGRFELFYLIDFRDQKNHGEGTPWYRISTTDFVHFTEHGEMIGRGGKTDQDLFVFTGSALHANDQFHIFYTGHNHHLIKEGKPQEAVMHALSNDLSHWEKQAGELFFAPGDRYEKDDWRDPFVFYNQETGKYNMLLAARFKNGVPRRRGLTALCSSSDLKTWTVEEPFYAPDLYFTHECPDLFKMGDWWYLVFSEFSDKVQTRYRMSKSLKGPWRTPVNDSFDAHAFYAAKSASDGKKRYMFGWNPTRRDNSDNGTWEWGGNLVVHEIYPSKTGELFVKAPQTVIDAFQRLQPVSFSGGTGRYEWKNNTLSLKARETFAAAVAGPLPEQCRISGRITYGRQSREFGIMLRTSADLASSYFIRFEPERKRMVFDKWPRFRPEVPQMAEFERPMDFAPSGIITFQLFVEGTKGVIYINEQLAMNFRAYDLPVGGWGFFATDAEISVHSIELGLLEKA